MLCCVLVVCSREGSLKYMVYNFTEEASMSQFPTSNTEKDFFAEMHIPVLVQNELKIGLFSLAVR